jgi:hypothetical protein
MRTNIWITLTIGVFLLSGVAFAQSPDDEQKQTRQDQEQDQPYQAPGVHIWIGRMPSKDELKAAILELRSQTQTSTSRSDEPDFQNDKVKVWIGRIPSREALRKSLQRQ